MAEASAGAAFRQAAAAATGAGLLLPNGSSTPALARARAEGGIDGVADPVMMPMGSVTGLCGAGSGGVRSEGLKACGTGASRLCAQVSLGVPASGISPAEAGLTWNRQLQLGARNPGARLRRVPAPGFDHFAP